MGLLAANGWADGSVRYRGTELIGLSPAALNRYRGRKLAMIFQEPMTSLDPLFRIGDQIALPLHRTSGPVRKAQARARALELLELVRIPAPSARLDAYPHELSGGQRQRVMIAMALANDPDILIADEPTTALDVTIEARILALLAELQTRLGMAVVLITHDLGLVRRFADRVYVMQRGEVVESGETGALFAAPAASLYAHAARGRAGGPQGAAGAGCAGAARSARHARHLRARARLLRRSGHVLHAVDGVDLALRRGRPSASSANPAPANRRSAGPCCSSLPSAGTIRFEDRELSRSTAPRCGPCGAACRSVFQDPFGSLSPRMTVGEIVDEGLLVHEPASRAGSATARCAGLRGGPARSRLAQPLSARILRRPAPAHRDRPRDDPASGAGRARRADLGARPHRAEGDRRAAERPAGRTASPISSSATTSPWCAPWPTGSW